MGPTYCAFRIIPIRSCGKDSRSVCLLTKYLWLCSLNLDLTAGFLVETGDVRRILAAEVSAYTMRHTKQID